MRNLTVTSPFPKLTQCNPITPTNTMLPINANPNTTLPIINTPKCICKNDSEIRLSCRDLLSV